MNATIQEKLNGFGSLLRLVTPILIATVGTLIIGGQSELKIKIVKLETHFVNHLMHHQDLEVGYAERLKEIESTRFTDDDGQMLYDKIKGECPPKWLKDKVECLTEDVKELKKGKRR